ncbi:MAG: hypothetical protein ACJ76H_17285 [Bacteriovoracaceae bacterium]
MKKVLGVSLMLAVMSTSAIAQMRDSDCDPNEADCSKGESQVKEPNHDIYPYKPFSTDEMRSRIERMTENKNFLWDIREMERRGLNRANTRVQPWGGSFWPLIGGGVANTYQKKDQTIFITTPLQNVMWQKNYSDFKKRREKVYPNIYDLSEEELAKLAPSEKYDLILGDTTFDLTNRVWDYVQRWGSGKKWNFLTKIDLPDGYRIPEASHFMAIWEGICHGWALGAGYTARPEKTFFITLPNGKKMAVYPNDVKALASLMWANSTIQDNVLFEGNRCNKRNPDRDKFGRFIDTQIDQNDSVLLPRCADVHPGVFHTTVVNVMGIEGRPIVLDHNAKLPIANQPVGGYELEYFNPKDGKTGPLSTSMISVSDYGDKDLYKINRNPETAYIVGVAMNVKYIDWELPKKHESNTPADDTVVDYKFNYDLEINAAGKIVGGQWRVSRKGGTGLFKQTTNQPDYFWLAPRDYKKYFQPVPGISQWDDSRNPLPPAEWKDAAKVAHSFQYEESAKYWGASPTCTVFPVDKDHGKDPIKVPCEFRYPKPQPLIQVVDKLVEMARR